MDRGGETRQDCKREDRMVRKKASKEGRVFKRVKGERIG